MKGCRGNGGGWGNVGGNVRNQVLPVLLLLQAAEGHLGAGNVLLGVLEVLEQGAVVQGDALLLVGIRVRVAVDGAGLAAEQAVQGRADLVAAARLDGVALRAARLEEGGALLGVTWWRRTSAYVTQGVILSMPIPGTARAFCRTGGERKRRNNEQMSIHRDGCIASRRRGRQGGVGVDRRL